MLLATSGLNAQKEEDKYAALVSEVRNEVWSLNLVHQYASIVCPSSTVLLFVHRRYSVERNIEAEEQIFLVVYVSV